MPTNLPLYELFYFKKIINLKYEEIELIIERASKFYQKSFF